MNATSQYTIRAALDNLEILKDRIDEIEEAFRASRSEEHCIGWEETSDFAEFYACQIGDPTPALQLVGIALGMGERLPA